MPSVGYYGSPLPLPFKEATKLATKQVVSDCLKETYSHLTPDRKLGERVEDKVCSLLPFLEGYKEHTHAEAGSSLDCEVKADIAVSFTSFQGAFQVKSSEGGASSHLQKTCFKGTKRIAPPGVFWCEEASSPLEVLVNLSRFLSTSICPDVIEICKIAKSLKAKGGRFLPLSTFKFTKIQLSAGSLLGIFRVEGSMVRFL
jgi:hypothetical protein